MVRSFGTIMACKMSSTEMEKTYLHTVLAVFVSMLPCLTHIIIYNNGIISRRQSNA